MVGFLRQVDYGLCVLGSEWILGTLPQRGAKAGGCSSALGIRTETQKVRKGNGVSKMGHTRGPCPEEWGGMAPTRGVFTPDSFN